MSDGTGQDIPEESQTSDREGYHIVKLSRIKGLLPCLDQLYDELSIPPFRQVPSDIHSEKALIEVLTLHPLRVAMKDKRMRCTGNVRLFRLATRFLPGSADVPCIVEALLPDLEIKQRALNELIYGMAYLGVHFSEINVLAEVARRATAAGYMTVTGQSVETMISKLYRVDKRKLKAQPQVSPSKSEHLEQDALSDSMSEVVEPLTQDLTVNAPEGIMAGPVRQITSAENLPDRLGPSEATDEQS
jgi:hypothetical protein